MKSILTLLLCGTIYTLSIAQPPHPVLDLKGNVGITVTNGYDAVGLKDGIKKLEYFQNGQLRKYEVKKWGEVVSEGEYNIQKEENRALIQHYNTKTELRRNVFLYENGTPRKVNQEVLRTNDGVIDLIESKVNYFDNEGKMKNSLFYKGDISNEPFKSIYEITYDDKGRLIGYIVENQVRDSIIKKCIVYQWNDKDQCILKSVFRNCEQLVREESYNYSDDNKTLSQEIDILVYPLDKPSNPNMVPIDQVLLKYKYLLDDHGNWTKRYIINEKGKKKLNAKREIQYDI